MGIFLIPLKLLAYVLSMGRINLFKAKVKKGNAGLPTQISVITFRPSVFQPRKRFVESYDKIVNKYDELIVREVEGVEIGKLIGLSGISAGKFSNGDDVADMFLTELSHHWHRSTITSFSLVASGALISPMANSQFIEVISDEDVTATVYDMQRRVKRNKEREELLKRLSEQGSIPDHCPSCGIDTAGAIDNDGDCANCAEPLADLDSIVEEVA